MSKASGIGVRIHRGLNRPLFRLRVKIRRANATSILVSRRKPAGLWEVVRSASHQDRRCARTIEGAAEKGKNSKWRLGSRFTLPRSEIPSGSMFHVEHLGNDFPLQNCSTWNNPAMSPFGTIPVGSKLGIGVPVSPQCPRNLSGSFRTFPPFDLFRPSFPFAPTPHATAYPTTVSPQSAHPVLERFPQLCPVLHSAPPYPVFLSSR
jgi:hypothetical protein